LSEERIKQILKIFKSLENFEYEDEIPNTYPIPFSYNWLPVDPTSIEFMEVEKKLKNRKPKSLYIGIPFCNYRCEYCVYTILDKYNVDQVDNYIDLLFKELQIFRVLGGDYSDLTRIYIGGGTPSILNREQITRLFDLIASIGIDINKIKSFTYELSPESIDELKIETLNRYVNRFSIGIQDINQNILKKVCRRTSSEIIQKAIGILSKNKKYYNVDLIYGLPDQTENDWTRSLIFMIENRVPELTLYNSRVGRRSVITKLPLQPHEEKLRLSKANNILEESGYIQVRPFHWIRDIEIKKLWKNYKYAPFSDQHSKLRGYEIGIGTSAVSHISNLVFKNYDIDRLDKYSERLYNGKLTIEKIYRLSENDFIIRKLLYSVEEGRFDYNQLDECYKQKLSSLYHQLLKLKLIEFKDNDILLTKIGKIFYNNIEKEIITTFV
jgi:oxygen-independent coproporphyrinogen-3 oxidase